MDARVIETTNHETNTTMNKCKQCGNEFVMPSSGNPDYCFKCIMSAEIVDVPVCQPTAAEQISQLTNERDELRETVKQIKTAAYCRDLTDSQLITHIMTVADSWLERERNLVKERDQLAAKCAALTELSRSSYSLIIEHHSSSQMREELIECSCCVTKRGDDILNKLHAAYTNPDQCGVGWLSPEKKKVLVEAVKNLRALVPIRPRAITYDDGWVILDHVQDVFLPKVEQALEAAQ